MSGGLTRKSWVVYLLVPGNKYEDVVSYFLGLKVSIDLWSICKRAVQLLLQETCAELLWF
jgi:hypothetical protein